MQIFRGCFYTKLYKNIIEYQLNIDFFLYNLQPHCWN